MVAGHALINARVGLSERTQTLGSIGGVGGEVRPVFHPAVLGRWLAVGATEEDLHVAFYFDVTSTGHLAEHNRWDV